MSARERIAVIGCGALGSALVKALLPEDSFDLIVVESDRARRGVAQSLLDSCESSRSASITCSVIGPEITEADLLVLVVKPQDVEGACGALKSHVRQGQVVLSLVAGIRNQTLKARLGEGVSVIRAMPNLAAQVGASATAVYFGEDHADTQALRQARPLVSRVIEAMGVMVEIRDEGLLDAVTAVAGSGPAYFFALIENLIQAAVDLGLPPEDARTLVLQTALGSAEVLKAGARSPAEWRAAVTSPQGTTAAAFEILEREGWGEVFQKAVARACERATELARIFHEKYPG